MAARLTGQRLRTGTHTAASLTSSYEIDLLAISTDMNLQPLWTVDDSKSEVIKIARQTQQEDLSLLGDGPVEFSWVIGLMTFEMISLWMSVYLTGLSFTTGIQYAPVTAMTYDYSNTAVFVQANLWLPDKINYVQGGWKDTEWKFKDGVIIT